MERATLKQQVIRGLIIALITGSVGWIANDLSGRPIEQQKLTDRVSTLETNFSSHLDLSKAKIAEIDELKQSNVILLTKLDGMTQELRDIKDELKRQRR